jgi:hypothetical protein
LKKIRRKEGPPVAGVVKTFLCLPDGTVLTNAKRSKRLAAALRAGQEPELVAVTVVGDAEGREITGCGVNWVTAVPGGVLVPRKLGANVVAHPRFRPRIGLEAYRRLLGIIVGTFGPETTMRAYYPVLWPRLQAWVEDDVLCASHLGPCLETRDPGSILEAAERHRGSQVLVSAKMCTYDVQAPIGEYVMFLEEIREEYHGRDLALVLVGCPLRFSGSDTVAAMSKVVLPYHPGKISAEVYPDGLKVISVAAGLELDLVDLRVASPEAALPSLFF